MATWLERWRWLLFALLLLAALGLRLYKLNAYSIWLDEAWQYGSSDHPLDRIREAGSFPVDQMFLSMLVTHLNIITHFDADAWQLRMPPVLFGVAAVGVTFLLVREIFEERAAWIAALLAACWPRLIQYSQEMRAYSLFVLLATVAAFSLHRALRTNSIGYWALFSVAVVLELYNHFIAATNAISWALFAGGWILIALIASFFPKAPASARRASFIRLGLAAGSALFVGLALWPVVRFYVRFQEAVSRQGYRGRSTLLLDAETLRGIFGSIIGLGDNTSLCVIGGLALLGLVYAWVRFPRGAALCLLWIGMPIAMAMIRNSGQSLISSTRYLQFITPPYLAFVAAGVLAIAVSVAWLAGRFSISLAPRSAAIVRAALTIVLLGLTVSPLKALYSHDPKEVPVDLRSAYSYVLDRATPNDIVLGFGDNTFWHSGWFRATDPYYLRFKPGVVREVITMGTMNYAAIPWPDVDRATGKLFAMMPSRPDLQSKIREVAGDQYDTKCWARICVLESRGDRPPGELFDDFCTRFEFLDPPGLAAARKEHAEARANPR